MSGCTNTQGNREASTARSGGDCQDDQAQCPLQDAALVAVEFLDGDADTALSQTGKQWVNLPREAKWVDGTIVSNIDRLSRKPRVKVRFDTPGRHSFNLKYEPDDDNVAYTDGEKNRNSKFKYQHEEKSYTTDADGTKIITDDFFVPAGGTYKYKLKAGDDNGNTAESPVIETHRLVYYLEIKMQGIPAASSLSAFEDEYAKHNIKMEALPEVSMARLENIGSNAETNTFKSRARAAYTGSDAPDKEEHVLAIGYTDHLAVKNANQRVRKDGVQVGPGKSAVEIPIRGAGLRAGDGVKDRYLWQNIVSGEGWFVSAAFEANDGSSARNIPEARCTAVPVNAARPDASRMVRVDVTDLPEAEGRITLHVNWVDRMRGGLAFRGGNLACVCTRSWWRDKSTQAQNEVIIHEIGHKIGMVIDGSGSGPDRVSTQYDGKGHVGSHCHHDLSDSLSTYAGANGSKCVMFGATNGKSAFCENCAPAVKKQDLSTGWSRF